MKFNNVKIKTVALGLALSMGISPIGSTTSVYAADEMKGIKATETTSEAEPVEDERMSATAKDITKDICDETFSPETCMDGIMYDSEAEDVTLSSIAGDDGSTYQPKQVGIYFATYQVVPKDQSEAYFIQRNIILTDEEGQAHTEKNGGGKQKEDTLSEEESDTSAFEMPEVEVTSTQKSDTKEMLEALEGDIESGNVLLFSGADSSFSSKSTVNLEKGETIYYPSYIGNYITSWFRVNGKTAYCLESHKANPPTGDYIANVLDSNKNLQKVLYYGYGGAGDVTRSYLPGKSAEEKYVYTHIAASYAYAGEAGFTGCDYTDLVNAGVIGYIDYLFGQEVPPKGEISLSKTKVEAVREGDIQKTPDIKLYGDHRNYITITVPKDVTCQNKTKNTSATNGELKIYGGDTFCLSAKMSVSGNYASGSLQGSVRETWRTLVLSTGETSQDIGVFESETAEPVSFKTDWLDMAKIELMKKDAETNNPLLGAVYGIYTDSACKNLLLQMPITDDNGKAVSGYFDATIKTVYVKEITPPASYTKNKTVYPVSVSSGKVVKVEAVNQSIKGKITLRKIDLETQAFLPQGDASLAGAVYGLYAKDDIKKPDGTGVLYKKGSLIQQKTIGESGEAQFDGLYLGAMVIREISSPEGYLPEPSEIDATLTAESPEKDVVVRTVTSKEQVMKQAFQIIKVSEDGEQTETDLVKGAEFTVYLISDLSKVKDGSLKPSNGSAYTAVDFIGYKFAAEKPAVAYENGKPVPVPVLVTDAKGYAKSVELPYGTYICVETKTPANLKQVNPFLVTVTKDSREPQQWRVFDDRPFDFLLKIIKKDAQTNRPVLKNSATYKIYDCKKKAYVEQMIQYPDKGKISEFSTNAQGFLVLPQALKAGLYRIDEIKSPDSYVRQGYEQSLVDGEKVISPLEVTETGMYKESPKEGIELVINTDTPHQIDPDTGAYMIEVTQYNDEQVGSLTLKKVGEQLKEVKGRSVIEKVAGFFADLKDNLTGKEADSTGIKQEFVYQEDSVEGAVFELRAKDTIYSPDHAVDEAGNLIIRYQKDDLVATLATNADGTSVANNLPIGSYYLKETKAGEHFVLNPEQKEFTLSAKDDTAAVVYEGVTYKNKRQKVEISIYKKDSISEKPLEGVVFDLYAGEDIMSAQGKILIPKDTLIESKATSKDGKLTFDSQICHGKYYVKEQHLPGYLPNEDIWEFEAVYENQNDEVVVITKEVENQPTESHFTKTDLTTGKELEGATLQIIDSDKEVVEEWLSTKEPHIVYGLPNGDYILHEKLAPFKDGYVSAVDVNFTVLEDGSVLEVEMKDEYSKVEISKTDLTTGKELEGAKMQVLDKDKKVLEEWVTDGKPYQVEKLPVGAELTLREITAPDGYEIAEDVKFTLKDTTEVQKVQMKDARITEKPAGFVPKTGDAPLKPIILLVVCAISGAVWAGVTVRRRKRRKKDEEK